jgi:hypothetical protein
LFPQVLFRDKKKPLSSHHGNIATLNQNQYQGPETG